MREAMTIWGKLFSFRDKSLFFRGRLAKDASVVVLDLNEQGIEALRTSQGRLSNQLGREVRARGSTRGAQKPAHHPLVFPYPPGAGFITVDNARCSVVF